MSEYHKTDEEWIGFILNDFTVLKKTGEYQFTMKCHGNEYTYTGDFLDVQCKCGRIFNIKSKSFIHNKPTKCRFCHKRKITQTIGEECGTLVVQHEFHDRNKSGRSVLWFECKCNKCGGLSKYKADVFRQGESSCKNCRIVKQEQNVVPRKLRRKIEDFSISVLRDKNNIRQKKKQKPLFTLEEFLEKTGDSPICYLTGQPIDISKPKSYQFDHKIPRSRGGDNSLDNLGLCVNRANRAKYDLTPEEFYYLCKDIVEYLKPQFETHFQP